MSKFNIQLIKTDVTSLKIYKNYLLAGIGSQLHIYDLETNELLRKDTHFDGLRIHGIEMNRSGSHILLNAENELLILQISFKNLHDDFHIDKLRIPMDDWILSTKWLKYNNFVLVTMHNHVEFYNNETLMLKQNTCDTKCILYCAHVAFDTVRECIVMSGTVFSEILIWRPFFSGEVIHRLKGHEGVLFSIDYLNSYILSTSDDRSVTLWQIDGNLQNVKENAKISLKHQMHGHTARVFCGRLLTNNLLSAGEDGRVNIWDFDGHLLKTFNVHHGGSVWALECDESRNLIVSGGSDSSIARLPLSEDWNVNVKIKICEREVPKKLVMLQNGDVVVIAESGLLMHYSKLKNVIVNVGCFKEFESYALLEVSSCRRKFVLGGLHGDIKVFSLDDNQLVEEFNHRVPNKKRIFAIHWLTCKHLLTCGPEGVLYLWKLQKTSLEIQNINSSLKNSLLLIGKYVLPPSKERWSTSACRIPNLGIAIGDRKGNLHYFKMADTNPSHTIKKAHSHLGITQLYWNPHKNMLTSFGRNSTIRNYHLSADATKLTPITSDVLPFSWLGAKLANENTILGFSGNEMLLWDYDKRLELFKTNCGGGHRSWDFFCDSFVYIRDKAVNCLRTNRPIELSSSIHSTEMNTMRCLKFSDRILFISGGEDTTLRFSSFLLGCDESEVKAGANDLVNVATIKSHLSSIRCMHIVSKHQNESNLSLNTCNLNLINNYELVTAGGRGQIIYWCLTLDQNGDFLFCKELHAFYEQEDEEIRVMDLTSVRITSRDETFLFAACSDGSVKVYNLKNNQICLHRIILYKLRCILKLCILPPFNEAQKSKNYEEGVEIETTDDCLLVTMATDGHLVFWKMHEVLNDGSNETKPVFSYNVQLSGINAFDFRYIDKNKFCFLSGGDDNQISLVLCKYSNGNLSVLCHYRNVESHCAQITGAYLSEKCFFTASLDQKLLMFDYEVKNDEITVSFREFHNSTISDIKGMNIFHVLQDHDKFEVILYGLGVELLRLELNN